MLSNTIRVGVKYCRTLNVPHCINAAKWHINVKRHYAEMFRRKPAAIVNEEELFEVVDDDKLKEKMIRKQQRQKIKESKRKRLENQKIEEAKQAEEKANKNTYTKLHENKRILSSIILLAKTKNRKKEQKIVLEGHRLMKDAIESGILPEIVIYSKDSLIKNLPPLPKENVQFYKVPYKSIQLWSSVMTSTGLMGIFPLPKIKTDPPEYAIPLTIICDNVRDPGNMGSILRAAAAVGCEKLILLKGCVDIWDPKVLRSAAGAHFKLPIHATETWDKIIDSIHPDAEVFAADNNNKFCEQIDDDILKIDEDVMDSETEIDNLFDDKEEQLEIQEEAEDETKIQKEQSRKNKSKLCREKLEAIRKSIPIVPYYSINYTNAETILIVGGETEGLSEDSLSFLKSRSGARVNIPLYNNIESLNSGMAAGIVAYEINRQYTLKAVKESKKD